MVQPSSGKSYKGVAHDLSEEGTGRHIWAHGDAPLLQGIERRDCPVSVGDMVYVRETFGLFKINGSETSALMRGSKEGFDVHYRATDSTGMPDGAWRPSMHMTKELARIWLKVTEVRVQRLHDFTEEQAQREGVPLKNSPAADFTNHLRGVPEYWNRKAKPRFAWSTNPWVWMFAFEVVPGYAPAGEAPRFALTDERDVRVLGTPAV